jgi:phosphopantetheinyl transferase
MVTGATTYRYSPLARLQAALARLDVDRFLTTHERAQYSQKRHPGWLAGRMLAKQLILDQLRIQHAVRGALPQQLQIDSGGVGPGQYRPRVSFNNEPLDWSLSISHTAQAVLVTLCTEPGKRVGADLVEHAVQGRGFAKTWFTRHERRSLNATRDPRRLSAAWAVKEATYKACNRGEPFRPRQIHVSLASENQYDCAYRGVPLASPSSVRCWNVDDHFAVIVTSCTTTDQTDINIPPVGYDYD